MPDYLIAKAGIPDILTQGSIWHQSKLVGNRCSSVIRYQEVSKVDMYSSTYSYYNSVVNLDMLMMLHIIFLSSSLVRLLLILISSTLADSGMPAGKTVITSTSAFGGGQMLSGSTPVPIAITPESG